MGRSPMSQESFEKTTIGVFLEGQICGDRRYRRSRCESLSRNWITTPKNGPSSPPPCGTMVRWTWPGLVSHDPSRWSSVALGWINLRLRDVHLPSRAARSSELERDGKLLSSIDAQACIQPEPMHFDQRREKAGTCSFTFLSFKLPTSAVSRFPLSLRPDSSADRLSLKVRVGIFILVNSHINCYYEDHCRVRSFASRPLCQRCARQAEAHR